jgi:high-affinity nickel-transport protein
VRVIFTEPFSRRITVVYALLLTGNAAAWLWGIALFGSNPVLIGTAVLAYVLGLRHAVDADHIAAIDNVTRKLMQQGQKPATVGLWFSLGHSTVVALACAAIAVTSVTLRAHFAALRDIGSLVGTGVSAGFLFIIAMANIVTLISIWRAFRRGRADRQADAGNDLPGGILMRILKPMMAVIARPEQMYPLGFLFGLGFDTASEVGLLGISASQASHAVPLWTIMVFPALFTAGMSLIDTTDGLFMVGAYGWALVKPMRKLIYNFTITLFSILVALIIGALEALNLIADRFALNGAFWKWVANLNDHFGALGCAVILTLLGCWALSATLSRTAANNADAANARIIS